VKFLDEYRDPQGVRRLAGAIERAVTRPWTLMEICGGQTHAIVRFGLDQLLPPALTLVHGPGCPVCVTPVDLIDKAIAIARRPGAILCSFGDMLRVPGSAEDLFSARAAGGDVRIVYSPMDALRLAEENPGREVVFFAVGFETTAPANAMPVHAARRRGVKNFSILVSHVLVPPAMEAILGAPGNRVQGFLAAGHVCAVMGAREYEPISRRHRAPIVITGFEPLDILRGVLMCVEQLESGRGEVENAYGRVVRPEGNPAARALIAEVFQPAPRLWRGIGEIPASGYALRPDYAEFDAERRFGLTEIVGREAPECVAGEILQGRKKPFDCPAFGVLCTPERPLGAPMVSSEGACAAYYRYRRHAAPEATGNPQ